MLLIAAAVTPMHHVASVDDLVRLLDRTVWIDIGLGRKFATLTPRQVAELKRCKEPTMAFQKAERGWVQSFYAGIEMRTVYSAAVLKNESAGSTILLYVEARALPVETLSIAKTGDVLVEQTQGFRPHTFLKCSPAEPARPKH